MTMATVKVVSRKTDILPRDAESVSWNLAARDHDAVMQRLRDGLVSGDLLITDVKIDDQPTSDLVAQRMNDLFAVFESEHNR